MSKNLLFFFLGVGVTVALFLLRPIPPFDSPISPIHHSPLGDRSELSAWLEKLLDDKDARLELESSAIGFCLLGENGKVVVGVNEDQAFIPASTLKTVTSATALEIFGPEYRFKTELRSPGKIRGEGEARVLGGDLVLRGGGDPTLSVDDLADLVAKLKEKGIGKIEGNVIGDARFFKDEIFDDFWNWGDIGNGYGSPVGGLNLNHNRYLARFRPGAEVGVKAEFLGADPLVPAIKWINRVSTGPSDSGDGVMIYGGEHTSAIELRGTVPEGKEYFEVVGAVPNPALFAAHHLNEALKQAGIEVSGKASTATEGIPEDTELLTAHDSLPLIEIITHLHKVSDNHETECLFRLIGKRMSKPSVDAIREHWKSRGLEFATLRMEDGSGLARANFIRPVDLARLQQLAAAGPQGSHYRSSLLTRYQEAARWKGGAMSGVRAYTGLVTNASGREYGFAIMVNHYEDSGAVAKLRDALMEEFLEGEF